MELGQRGDRYIVTWSEVCGKRGVGGRNVRDGADRFIGKSKSGEKPFARIYTRLGNPIGAAEVAGHRVGHQAGAHRVDDLHDAQVRRRAAHVPGAVPCAC